MDMRRRDVQLLRVWVALMVVAPVSSVLPRLVIHLFALVVIAALAGAGLCRHPRHGHPRGGRWARSVPAADGACARIGGPPSHRLPGLRAHLARSGVLVTTAHLTWPAATLVPSAASPPRTATGRPRIAAARGRVDQPDDRRCRPSTNQEALMPQAWVTPIPR
jgi:hypothetical protein